MSANLLAYLRFHLRDAAVRGLAPALFFVVLVTIPLYEFAQREGLAVLREPGKMQDEVVGMYRTLLATTMTLGAFLVASGFVAKDREAGYVRFLFSTPVVPWRFYLQRYLVGLTLFVAIYALLAFGFGWVVTPVAILPAVRSAALYGFLIGGTAMLSGAITRHDGALLAGSSLLGYTLQQVVRIADGNQPTWMEVLAQALPPIDAADQVRSAWLAGNAADSGQLALVLAWSAAMLVVALFIIKRAPLVR